MNCLPVFGSISVSCVVLVGGLGVDAPGSPVSLLCRLASSSTSGESSRFRRLVLAGSSVGTLELLACSR